MKKIMSLMLGLSLLGGTVAAFAAPNGAKSTKTKSTRTSTKAPRAPKKAKTT